LVPNPPPPLPPCPQLEDQTAQFRDVIAFLKERLGERIEKVRRQEQHVRV